MTVPPGSQPALELSRYVTLAPAASGGIFLAHSAFTGATLELEEAEYRLIEAMADCDAVCIKTLSDGLLDRLRNAGILVPAGFDERASLKAMHAGPGDNNAPLVLTIAPTIQCNMRCTYCFEDHRQEYMSPAVEARLMAFVEGHLPQSRSAGITWFGGEPLLNFGCIERIQSFINDLADRHAVPVTRSIITNGYLLSDATIQRLMTLGTWSAVQVTIDGLPALHNQRRPLRSGRDTWRRIVDNCLRTLDFGLPLALRINTDRKTAQTLPEVLDLFIAEGLLPRADIGLGFIVDSTEACGHVSAEVLTPQDRSRIAIRFDAELLKRGLPPVSGLPQPLCGPKCSVEAEKGFVVAPSGFLFKCWNQVDRDESEAIGHVDGRSVASAARELDRWKRQDPFSRTGCFSCKALPTCMGGCPWEAERLANPARGECDPFRFQPAEIVQLGHLRTRMGRTKA